MQQQTEAEVVIRARAHQVMDVIADLPAYPRWCPGVREATVRSSLDDGRPERVQVVLDSGPIQDTVEYVYDWTRDNLVQWWQTEGTTLTSLRGSYRCSRVGRGSTLVTYRLAIELALPMISALQRRAENHIVSTALEGLKERVEGRT